MKAIVCCMLLLLVRLAANAQQVITNPDEAFRKAKTDNKPVLLIFSGSDWCVPCMKFQKILNDSSFQAFAQQHLILSDVVQQHLP